jgi:hypothetical protein
MSDTPTFASLLTQWSGGGTDAREAVYAHLRAHSADAAAVEAAIRQELNSPFARNRIIAAEAMLAVYADEPAAAATIGWVFRQADPGAALDAIPVLRALSPAHAAPRFGELASHTPDVFRGLAPDLLRTFATSALRAGPDGVGPLLAMLAAAGETAETPLLIGVAEAAPGVRHDLEDVEAWLRARLPAAKSYAVGAALWRVSWRVNSGWIASIEPYSEQLEGRDLLALLVEVLGEHLGRRPDLAPLVGRFVVWLSARDFPAFEDAVSRLGAFGRGWSALLPVLSDGGNHALATAVRVRVFREAVKRPAVWSLAHHHAHAVILERDSDRTAVSAELLEAAGELLQKLGPLAGSALPDVLGLIEKQPDTARLLTSAVRAITPGWPLPAAAVARALDRVRRAVVYSPDAFAALAEVYADLARDAWPRLVDDTGFDRRTVAALLDQPAWDCAPAEVRRADALALADRLSSPRAAVRLRAAELLRGYHDRTADVWPALVALLVSDDEKAALTAIPLFRHLHGHPVADVVAAELKALFHERNPAYAARAVVALWRLGRMPIVADDPRGAVAAVADASWGWAVLRGVAARAFPDRPTADDLSGLFEASPEAVAERVYALLNPPELPEEKAIAQHVRDAVYWDGVYQCVGSDSEGGLLFLALMCARGSAGFGSQKIWMIKHQRGVSGCGLGDAKETVERAIAHLTATASRGMKRACVHAYFRAPHGPPACVVGLLEHPVSWYRWAALELLDAWRDALGGLLEEVEERVWDRSALVRARALRLLHGEG